MRRSIVLKLVKIFVENNDQICYNFPKIFVQNVKRELIVKQKKMLAIVLTFLVSVMMLAGCGKKFDAKTYMQEYLNASYKQEFTEFCKISEQTEEEAKKVYEENLDKITGDILNAGGVEFSEELVSKYQELVKKMLNCAKYNVVSAEEDKDGNFVAKVEVEPLLLLDGLEEEVTKASEDYLAKVMDEMLAGGEEPDEQKIYDDVMTIVYDILNEKLSAPEYGEKETVEVHIVKKDNVYSPEQDDLVKLDAVVFNPNQ